MSSCLRTSLISDILRRTANRNMAVGAIYKSDLTPQKISSRSMRRLVTTRPPLLVSPENEYGRGRTPAHIHFPKVQAHSAKRAWNLFSHSVITEGEKLKVGK